MPGSADPLTASPDDRVHHRPDRTGRRRDAARGATRGAVGAALATVLLLLGVAGPVATGDADAVAARVTVSPGTAVGGNDYATQVLGDAWDFASPDDLPLVPGVTAVDLRAASVTGDRLVVDAAPGGFVAPLVSWDDLGAVPWGRDASLFPVDAGRYTRMSVHMRVDAAATGTVMWFTCGVAVPSCQGAKGFTTTPGWRTYDIPLTTGAGGRPWQGLIRGLRFYPADPGGRAEIEWIRLYSPGETATVGFTDSTPGTAPQVLWDLDAVPGNNTGASSGWGRLDVTGTGSSRTVSAGALPSGTYRVAVVDDGQTVYASTPLVVDGPPAPVVLDPDRTGGADYATLAGNPWDFADVGDVHQVGDAAWTVANGLLHGTNQGPLINDPYVVLSQYGPIDGSRFHRLTVRMGHDGGFGLEDAPGGGMNSRLVWNVAADPAVAQISDDLVVYPGWHTTTLDLATSPPNAILEPGTPGQAGWSGQQVTAFRIDPNEDRGARRWYLDDVRLAEDDTGYGGAFDIRFQDLDPQAGTTATIRADTDQAGCDGTVVASGVPVTAGVNTVRWAPRPVPTTASWICVSLTDGRRTTTAYAGGPLRMTTTPSPLLRGGSPFGSVDSVTRVPGGVSVSGWAIDPDTTDPIDVHVYVGGRGVATQAGTDRPDVGAVYPVYGAAHGFSATVPVTAGSFDMCAYAINVGTGSTTALRCQRVDVASTPIGVVDRTGQVPGGVRFTGWALDPDTADPIDVHTYAGASGVATTASQPRPDIAAAFPGYGAGHGFSTVVPVVAGGVQALCTYGINVGAGGLGVLGCPPADLRVDPWGVLDDVRRVAGGVRVTGWTLDPSTAASLDVHVYVSGVGTAIRADRPRPDLRPHFPDWPGAYGFDAVLPAPGAGPLQVCAFAIGQGPGGNAVLGCRDL